MKLKPILGVLVLCICLFFSAAAVSASSELKVSLAAPEGVKVKESFDVYVEFYHQQGIGAARATLTYDADHLSFKKATLEEKGDYDFFSCYDHGGELHFSLTNAIDELERQVVVLHFTPLDDTPARYPFQITFCEACDRQAQTLSVSQLPSCTVTAAARVVPDSKCSSSSVSSAASQAADVPSASSKSAADYHSSRVQASAIDSRLKNSAVPDETASAAEEEASIDDRVYYIHDQDTSFRLDKSFFLLLVGILVIFVTVIILTYRFIMKQKEKRARDKLFQIVPPLPNVPSRETPSPQHAPSSQETLPAQPASSTQETVPSPSALSPQGSTPSETNVLSENPPPPDDRSPKT